MTRRIQACVAMALTTLVAGVVAVAAEQSEATISIRGKSQTLRVLGTRGGQPVVVSSGDGGWIHLAPHVADVLARHGFFVVGFDSKAYLSSFTIRDSTLTEADVPGDYRVLVEYAAQGGKGAPILIGVSEGAGLSVLAATGPGVKERVRGVVGVGLPEKNELGWRWRDMAIYLTHGVPNEPLFNASDVVGRVAPTPLAAIHSTSDEFVPLPTLQAIMEKAREPKRVWTIKASNHGFSDNLGQFDAALIDAIGWINQK